MGVNDLNWTVNEMAKRNKNRILTDTHAKIMVRDGELQRVFTQAELQQWHDLVNKIRAFDEKELKSR
ncbi:MAG: hypothetical protein ABS942_11015 [Solibacillus sp.]